MNAHDRRGLGEIVAWASALLALVVVAVAQIFRSGGIDYEVRGLFLGLVVALISRGTKGAMDRSGAADAQRRERDPPPTAKTHGHHGEGF